MTRKNTYKDDSEERYGIYTELSVIVIVTNEEMNLIVIESENCTITHADVKLWHR
jgi:hypothetical protein